MNTVVLDLLCKGGLGQTDLRDCGRDSGKIRPELWERIHQSVPPQLQPGRNAVEVLEKPSGKCGKWSKHFGRDREGWGMGSMKDMSQEERK